MPEVTLKDVDIAYDTFGEGEPVILIAGAGQPAMMWQLGLVPALQAAGYRVVTFDNRGVEPSSSPPAPYTVEEMATDTLGLLDHLGLDGPVRFVGYSLGGWITETVAALAPERVRSAVFVGSANRPTAWEKAITTVERDLARSDVDLPPLFYATEVLRYLPMSDLQNNETVEQWLAMLVDEDVWPNPGRLGQYEACLSWSTSPQRTKAWPSLSMPCLVLAFEHDVDSPPIYAREAASAMPNAQFVEIAGAGHMGPLTHGDQVARAVLEFFASN